MGKYFWMKRDDGEKHDKQPGCMFGLAHVLGYHLWHSSGRKKVQHHKHERQRDDRRERSRKTQLFHHDDDETEQLLVEQPSRRSPETKKRSRKMRIRSLIAEEIAEESEKVQGKGDSFKPNLQRTYSIHHLESKDIDWEHPIIFFPGKMENRGPHSLDTTRQKAAGSQKATRGQSNCDPKDAAEHNSLQNPDVLEMFAVDKAMFKKGLQDADEGITNFSHSALGLTPKAKLSKSRSFPMNQLSKSRKLEPIKIESKQNVSYPRRSKFRARSDCFDYIGAISGERTGDVESNGALASDVSETEPNAVKNNRTSLATDKSKILNKFITSENNGEIADGKPENTMDRYGEKPDINDMKKHAPLRSTSLNESLEKYARLFGNSFKADAKLNSSKSLRVTNEYGHAPVHVRRILSLSNVDFYYLSSNFEALGDDPYGNGSTATTKATDSVQENSEEGNIVSLPASDGNNVLNANTTEICQKEPADGCNRLQIKDDACLSLPTSDLDHEKVDSVEEEECKPNREANCSDVIQAELPDQGFILDSDICLQEVEFCAELQTPEELEHESSITELNISVDSNEMENLQNKFLSTCSTVKNDEISDKTMHSDVSDGCAKMNDSDLYYVRHLLDQSGIAVDASEMSWHATDKPFSPELFEEVEAYWPHEQDQLTGWPDFHGCWHHRMLFDLVNEVSLEVYDISLPYYPKALSSSCHVRPFPAGNCFGEDVSTSIDNLLTLKPEEMESLDSIVAFDLAHDRSWMNLQTESECVALELEDMIFDEVLQEIMLS